MKIGEITVVADAVVDELDGGEAHGGHEVVRFRLGDQRAGDIHLDMRLGDDRGEFHVLRVDGEPFEPVGGFGKQRGVEAHPDQVIAEGA